MVLRPPIARGLRFGHRCWPWTEQYKSSNRANVFFREIAAFWGRQTPGVVAETTDPDAPQTTPGKPGEAGSRAALPRRSRRVSSQRAAVSRAALSTLFGAARRGYGPACSDRS